MLFGDGHGRRVALRRAGALRPQAQERGQERGAADRRRSRAGTLRLPGTSCSRARGAASAASPPCCRTSPRWASTSSTCRPCTRSARRIARVATTPSARARAIPAARGRSAARRAATMRSIPTSAARPTSTRWWPPRATRASSWRSTSRSRPRPTTRGSASTPSGSTAGPTARSSTPRTRPSATRTSTTSTGTPPSARQLWNALKDVVLGWCARGILAFRVDNPHTKPMPFWEWLIAEVRAVHPEAIFLAEAFTRPAPMTTLAKIGFSQSYTYFAWKNTKAELVEFVEQARSWSAFYRAEHVAEHAGHPQRVPPARRPAGVRGQARPRRDALAELRDLLGLRGVRERAGARGERGVPRLREVRGQEARPRRAAAAADPARERDPAGASGAAALREPDLARHPQRRSHCVCEARGRGCRDHGRQPRSGGAPGRAVHPPAGARPAGDASRPSTCSPTRATAGAPAGTTSGCRPAAPT